MNGSVRITLSATAEITHQWDTKGIYTIKAKAKDIYDMESDWGTLNVIMPTEYIPFMDSFSTSSRHSHTCSQSYDTLWGIKTLSLFHFFLNPFSCFNPLNAVTWLLSDKSFK